VRAIRVAVEMVDPGLEAAAETVVAEKNKDGFRRSPVNPRPICLTIAGSDPSGGAGIQADLKTMTSLGVYGMSVVTVLTAQNTLGVEGIFPVPKEFFQLQFQNLFQDIVPHVIKVGMLFSHSIIEGLWEYRNLWKNIPMVLDPVVTATSGDLLMEPRALQVLKDKVVPFVSLITPNIPEVKALLGLPDLKTGDLPEAGKRFLDLGAKNVLIKGAHGLGCTDYLFTQEGEILTFEAPEIPTQNTHGSGCTLSSAISAYLALGNSLREAVRLGKKYTWEAIRSGANSPLGRGCGPLDHCWNRKNQEASLWK